jgi:hypothetical protein
MKFLAILVLATFSVGAFADQCAWNTITDAISAKGLLTNKDVIFWCQNCNEKPSAIVHVKSATIARKNGSNELTVTLSNGKKENLDLAYTYVRTASDIFANVSHMVGCESTGALTFLKTGPGRKKVAHFYNDNGSKVEGRTALDEDIRPWSAMTKTQDSERLPANAK